MDRERGRRVYEELGVEPVINAAGNVTVLGGSILSPEVIQAIEGANQYFVSMSELATKSGQIIAELLGAEAAYVTPGCCAAMALGAAACMTGDDPARIGQLPDTTGIRNQVIIQKGLRYKYERCVTVPGAKLVQVGDDAGTTGEHIEAAIGDATAAILYVAPSRGGDVVPLEEVLEIGRRHGVPVILDAAAQVYPLERLGEYTTMGVDLVCYGAKYFGAPNSTGILCGRKDLVEAAALQSFIGFESNPHRGFGRPLKLDRQEIIAVVVALRQWMTMDHEARLEGYRRRVRALRKELDIPDIEMTELDAPVIGLRIAVDEGRLGKTALQISDILRAGHPSVWVRPQPGAITISVATISDGDELIIAEKLKPLLAPSGAPA